MSIRAWFRPPRHFIARFLVLTLVPSMLLVAFGWRLLQQDYELERKQIDLRREEATDLLVSALEQAVKTSEEALRDQERLMSAALTPDSISVSFDDTQLDAFPHGRLLYHPVAAPGFAAPEAVFDRGEELEHLRRDAPGAAAWFQELARKSPPPIRAGALIRAARNLRNFGAHEAALTAYAEATRLSGTAIGEVPTELFARWARCGLLAELGRTGQLRTEALELRELLLDGRWRITQTMFQRHLEAASAWAGAGEPPASYRLALSAAVDRLWSSVVHDAGLKPWTTAVVVQPFRAAEAMSGNRADRPAGGRATITAGGVQFTVLSQTIGNRTAALIAGPTYVQREWKGRIQTLENRHRVRAELQDAATRGAASGTSRRSAADTGLPWMVVVHAEVESSGSGRGRRMMWIGAWVILAAVVATGSYVIARVA